MKILRIIGILLLASLIFVRPVTAGPLRIALLSETTIQGDSIFLSHLLPPGVPYEIHRRAMSLLLGSAPAPGQTRLLDRESLSASLNSASFELAQFFIPEFVTVRRTGVAISREIVARAINARLAARSSIAPTPNVKTELYAETPTFSASTDPDLVITEMSYDRTMGCNRFRLHSRTDPKVPPFYAWTPGDNTHASLSASVLETAPALVNAKGVGLGTAGVVIVEPGRMASLHLHSANLSTLLPVRPLQPGQNGDTIRVRFPKSGKTLFARVIGTDSVEAVF